MKLKTGKLSSNIIKLCTKQQRKTNKIYIVGYKKELEMELSNILNKIKSKELELNVEIFYKNYFENLLLSLMINGDFKKCSIELRNFKRSITNFCNKYSCPCFIHIPQKIKIDYNDKKYSFKNKLMLYIYPYQKEYSQFSKFNSNNIEKTIDIERPKGYYPR